VVGDSVAVIGSGYVGTVVAACFASLGSAVIAVEHDAARLRRLRSGWAPVYEPGLDRLVAMELDSGRLRFSDSIPEAVANSRVVFMCVGVPSSPSGHPDVRWLEAAGVAVGAAIDDQIVVNKSTVPIGGERWLAAIIAGGRPRRPGKPPLPSIVANPEFLREGTAVADFLHPHRVVLGGAEAAVDVVADLYRPILEQSFPGGDAAHRPALVRTTARAAEMLKYAANAFLATKISFINEIANLCDRVDVDVSEVAAGIGLDPRIGRQFLRPGIGWGGSCLGKDLAALITTGRDRNYEPELLAAVSAVNQRQRLLPLKLLQEHLMLLQGRRICLFGLAFKPGTDDVRDSPALHVAETLLGRGVSVTGYDPVVRAAPQLVSLVLSSDPYQAAAGADALLVTTDWPEFLDLDWIQVLDGMQGDLLIDCRGLLDPETMDGIGFRYKRLFTWKPVPRAVPAEITLHDSDEVMILPDT
jgi:UDPglucose 6-dehydrogenase